MQGNDVFRTMPVDTVTVQSVTGSKEGKGCGYDSRDKRWDKTGGNFYYDLLCGFGLYAFSKL